MGLSIQVVQARPFFQLFKHNSHHDIHEHVDYDDIETNPVDAEPSATSFLSVMHKLIPSSTCSADPECSNGALKIMEVSSDSNSMVLAFFYVVKQVHSQKSKGEDEQSRHDYHIEEALER